MSCARISYHSKLRLLQLMTLANIYIFVRTENILQVGRISVSIMDIVAKIVVFLSIFSWTQAEKIFVDFNGYVIKVPKEKIIRT